MGPSSSISSRSPVSYFFRKTLPLKSAIASSKDLLKTFTVNVQRAEDRTLNVPLIAPFTIASSRLTRVENVAILELSNGCVGWGDAPILPHVTAKDQSTALAKAYEVCQLFKQSSGRTLGIVLNEINGMLLSHSFASIQYLNYGALSSDNKMLCCRP